MVRYGVVVGGDCNGSESQCELQQLHPAAATALARRRPTYPYNQPSELTTRRRVVRCKVDATFRVPRKGIECPTIPEHTAVGMDALSAFRSPFAPGPS